MSPLAAVRGTNGGSKRGRGDLTGWDEDVGEGVALGPLLVEGCITG